MSLLMFWAFWSLAVFMHIHFGSREWILIRRSTNSLHRSWQITRYALGCFVDPCLKALNQFNRSLLIFVVQLLHLGIKWNAIYEMGFMSFKIEHGIGICVCKYPPSACFTMGFLMFVEKEIGFILSMKYRIANFPLHIFIQDESNTMVP